MGNNLVNSQIFICVTFVCHCLLCIVMTFMFANNKDGLYNSLAHLFSGLSTSSQLKEHYRAYSSYPTRALPQNPTDTHIQTEVNSDRPENTILEQGQKE